MQKVKGLLVYTIVMIFIMFLFASFVAQDFIKATYKVSMNNEGLYQIYMRKVK